MQNKKQKKQDVSKNMPSCHFLVIVIGTESPFKIQKRAMFQRIGFVNF